MMSSKQLCWQLEFLSLQYSSRHEQYVKHKRTLSAHLPSEVNVEEVKIEGCLHESRHNGYWVDRSFCEITINDTTSCQY